MLRLRMHWTLKDEYIQIPFTPHLNLAGGLILDLGVFTLQIPIDHTITQFDLLVPTRLLLTA